MEHGHARGGSHAAAAPRGRGAPIRGAGARGGSGRGRGGGRGVVPTITWDQARALAMAVGVPMSAVPAHFADPVVPGAAVLGPVAAAPIPAPGVLAPAGGVAVVPALAPAPPAAVPAAIGPARIEAEATLRDRPDSLRPRRSFATLASEWTPHVNERSPTKAALEALGIVPRYNKTIKNETAPHPVSAGVRLVCTCQALAEFAKQGIWRVVSLFGSPRDTKLVADINSHVTDGPKMELDVDRPLVTPHDITRDTEWLREHPRADFGLYRGVLMVDVYEVGRSPFNPAYVHSVLEGKMNGLLIWIGHRFDGPAGTAFGESAWKRLPDGQILYRSDCTAQPYAPHSACDWLWQSGYEKFASSTLVWSVKQSIGGMHIVMFRLIPGASITPGHLGSTNPTVSMQQVAVPAFRSRWTGWLGRNLGVTPTSWLGGALMADKQVLIPLGLIRRMQAHASMKTITELQMKNLTAAARHEMDQDSETRLFYTLFPEEAITPEELVYAVIGGSISNRALEVTSFNRAYGRVIKQYNTGLSSLGRTDSPPIGMYLLYSIFTILATFLGLVLVRKIGRGIWSRLVMRLLFRGGSVIPLKPEGMEDPSGVINNSVKVLDLVLRPVGGWRGPFVTMLAPLWEEAFKRLVTRVTGWKNLGNNLIMGWEFVRQTREMGLVGSLGYLPTALMHYVANRSTYGAGVAIHSFWNQYVLFSRIAAERWVLFLAPDAVLALPSTAQVFLTMSYKAGMGIAKARSIYFSKLVSEDPMTPETAASYYSACEQAASGLIAGCLDLTDMATLAGAGLSALALTWWWNRSRNAGVHWAAFREQFYFDPWVNRPPIDSHIELSEPFPAELAVVPTQRAHTPIPEFTDELRFNAAALRQYRDDQDDTVRSSCWFICPWNYPGYSPARSDYNSYVVTACRVLAATPMGSRAQAAAWKEAFGVDNWANFSEDDARSFRKGRPNYWWMAQWIDNGFGPDASPECEPIPFDEWVQHLDSKKRKRILSARQTIVEQGKDVAIRAVHRTKLMVKTDELLFREDDEGRPQLKPRAIANVSPLFIAYIGPDVYSFQKRLAEAWGIDNEWSRVALLYADHLAIGPIPNDTFHYFVKMTYGGGRTDRDLSIWWRATSARMAAITRGVAVAIMVAGDDVVVVLQIQFRRYFWEIDLSMCDQTILEGALNHEFTVMRANGVPVRVVRELDIMAHSVYELESRDTNAAVPAPKPPVRIMRDEHPQRDTGGPNTSSGNTTDVGDATHKVVRDWMSHQIKLQTDQGLPVNPKFWEMDVDQVKASFLTLGLKVKIRVAYDIQHVTFLKGMWWRVESSPVGEEVFDYYWAPLPSRVLKATKTLTNPQVLYPRMSFPAACEQYMNDVACGYSYFAALPILELLEKRFLRRPPVRVDLFNPHKTGAARTPKPILDRNAAIEQMSDHYGVSPDMILSFERIFPRSIFTFTCHPFIAAMVRRDYG